MSGLNDHANGLTGPQNLNKQIAKSDQTVLSLDIHHKVHFRVFIF